jgi:NAD(P)-dependent dehydrogenase (short-subunit alcohol dehydrogenase family)
MDPTERIVIVAGGTGALGRAVSVAFLNAGATVAVTYRKVEEFTALAVRAGARAGHLDGRVLDAADEAAARQFVEGIVAKYGHLDVLVNAIGGYAGGQKLWETDMKIYERMFELNVRPGFALARAAVPVMLRQRHGCIVNVASRAALGHAAGAAAYAASKAAAMALCNSLAEELKGTGVRMNSILPSIIDTPANRKAMSYADFSKWPKPEEIARVVLFLASDDARLINGASIPVYGES